MKRIVVTGGSGKAGRAVVRHLVEHGYEVLNVDLSVPREVALSDYRKLDLTEQGQAFEALLGAEAVVHLAAIPRPNLHTDEVTFRVNMVSTFNVFHAAVRLGLQRVVWASSETLVGLNFDRVQPAYAPIDDDHPLYPETTYALSKLMGEALASQLNRWSGIPFVGLRISNIHEDADYQQFPTYWDDPWKRKFNLWSYVDARDVALSCRLALEADVQGAEHCLIAAADNCMKTPNSALMATVFPDVPLREGTGDFDTLLSIDKARRLLGYEPQYSWRQIVG